MVRKALLVIDMTNDFLLKSYNPNLALGRGLELVPRIKRVEESFLKHGLPVIYATDRHLKSDYELKKWGPHSMKDTEGSKIVEGLITDNMHVLERNWRISDVSRIKKGHLLFEVEKGTYSSFTDNGGKPTAMDALLKRLRFKPGDRIYITGLHTNCCDKHTAADAWFRGYVPVIVKDCVDAFDDPDGRMGMGHEQALSYESFWYDAEIKSSEDIVRELGQ
ncbi:MAG: cysteine hydrolase [Thaumarchaeota archaeon]|nr:cysteine hydrolase [Nitrososphaerota archaeon]